MKNISEPGSPDRKQFQNYQPYQATRDQLMSIVKLESPIVKLETIYKSCTELLPQEIS